jgi:hypothetical protein
LTEKFLSFDNFTLNENEVNEMEMSPRIKKSLERIGKPFKTDQEIVDAIVKMGYIQTNKRNRTAEYTFYDPKSGNEYATYSTGYVRAIMEPSGWAKRFMKATQKNMTPITRFMIPTTRERLLVVLRRVLKQSDLYHMWKKSAPKMDSDDPVGDFFQVKRGAIIGKKYGLN